VLDLVDTATVRGWIEPFGPFAAPAYVVLAGLLGAALVPGPVLAAVSGILFGAAVGTAVTIAASTLSAVLALLVARRGAGPQFAEVSGPRMQALTRLAERHGVVAVIVQRLIPGVPDAPASYLFGLLGVRVWQIAVGTAVGAAPRAFSYTAVGASLDDPGSALGIAGIAGVVVTGLAGALVAGRLLTRRGTGPLSRERRRLRRSAAAHGRTPPSAG
jgi:uncharacterized membrane protein YdjX (TVP38/TMEM64 family)